MSNANFDLLDKKCELANAKEMLEHALTSRSRTDLTLADIDFLDRTITAAQARIERAEMALRNIHA